MAIHSSCYSGDHSGSISWPDCVVSRGHFWQHRHHCSSGSAQPLWAAFQRNDDLQYGDCRAACGPFTKRTASRHLHQAYRYRIGRLCCRHSDGLWNSRYLSMAIGTAVWAPAKSDRMGLPHRVHQLYRWVDLGYESISEVAVLERNHSRDLPAGYGSIGICVCAWRPKHKRCGDVQLRIQFLLSGRSLIYRNTWLPKRCNRGGLGRCNSGDYVSLAPAGTRNCAVRNAIPDSAAEGRSQDVLRFLMAKARLSTANLSAA